MHWKLSEARNLDKLNDTDYAKEKGKRSFVISIDAPYDVQLYPNADGTLGACQIGGVTPDGWTVDESGAWIESIPRK